MSAIASFSKNKVFCWLFADSSSPLRRLCGYALLFARKPKQVDLNREKLTFIGLTTVLQCLFFDFLHLIRPFFFSPCVVTRSLDRVIHLYIGIEYATIKAGHNLIWSVTGISSSARFQLGARKNCFVLVMFVLLSEWKSSRISDLT